MQQLQDGFNPQDFIVDAKTLEYQQETFGRDLCDDGTGHCNFKDKHTNCKGKCTVCWGQRCPFCGHFLDPDLEQQGAPPLPEEGCPAKFLPTPIGKLKNNGTAYARDVSKFGMLPETPYRKIEKDCKKLEMFLTTPKEHLTTKNNPQHPRPPPTR
jgi:hypothetical protein